jgi:hypothetical protein
LLLTTRAAAGINNENNYSIMARGQNDYAGGIWVDEAWLDTVVVVGITCFVLCLMGLSKVSRATTVHQQD